MMGGEHRIDWVTTYPFNVLNKKYSYVKGHPMSKGDIKIGNDVWVGMNATIMSGVTIGDGAVIANGSIVSKDVKPYEIVGGNPAKHIKFRFDEEIINNLLEIAWWNLNNELLEKYIPLMLNSDIEKFINAIKNEQKN